jgi:hypothetical protein
METDQPIDEKMEPEVQQKPSGQEPFENPRLMIKNMDTRLTRADVEKKLKHINFLKVKKPPGKDFAFITFKVCCALSGNQLFCIFLSFSSLHQQQKKSQKKKKTDRRGTQYCPQENGRNFQNRKEKMVCGRINFQETIKKFRQKRKQTKQIRIH